MKKYPLLMKPFPKEIIWGGTKLKERYNKKAPFDKIAESWETSIRDGALSCIANGEYQGLTLREYLRKTKDSFSLLIKFIDAEDKLSVQVHPDDSVKNEKGESLGKTEMWYIVEADENAELVYGLKNDITVEDFKKAIVNGNTANCLNFVKVKEGETYFIPAGLVHAICKGILIAEIQQNSDTTYRIYDYDRIDKNGKKRDLHVEEALKVIKNYNPDEIKAVQYSKGESSDKLSNCDKFAVRKLEIENEATIGNSVKSFAITCVDGEGQLFCNDIEYPIKSGDTYFIPRDTGNIDCKGRFNLIISEE